MFEDLAADISSFTVRHSPALMGIFEPVSAIMFLNVDDAAFEAMRTRPRSEDKGEEADKGLLETFWHEAYHCFQTYCTGYLFEQFMRLTDTWMGIELSPARKKHLKKLMREYASMHLRSRFNFWMPKDMRIAFAKNYANLFRYQRLQYLQDRSAAFGQTSVAGAAMPELYSSLNAIRAESKVRGSDGVSTQDVIEASAFVYGKEVAFGRKGLEDRIHDDTLNADGPYQRAIIVADRVCPSRPPEIIRAAAALALRYEHPGEAYVPLLSRLSAEPSGDEVGIARQLSHDLPAIPAAGRYVGTACDAQQRTKPRLRTYQDQLAALHGRTWGIDEIDLLVNTDAIGAIPAGRLGFGIVTKGALRGFTDPDVMKARLVIGTRLLPTGPSVVELRREFEADMGVRLSEL